MQRGIALAVIVGAAGIGLSSDWTKVLPPGSPPAIPQVSPKRLSLPALGEQLFNDPLLSPSGKVSCATCHDAARGFASQGRPKGLDGYLLGRKAPSLLNCGGGRAFFWDGRAGTLEEQVWGPLLNRLEMGNHSQKEVIDRLRPKYGQTFKREFNDGLSASSLAYTLAEFERTIHYSGDFDKYLAGAARFTPEQARGYTLFRGKANCYRCHLTTDGAPLTDGLFHNTGVGGDDRGRYEVTKLRYDLGRFKTPNLSGVKLHPPYFHDGSVRDLESVIDFYDRGGSKTPVGIPDIQIFPLRLTPREKADLLAFLNTL